MKDWICYIVRCSDGTLYTGITNDLKSRISAHNEGTGARYTRGRGPVSLVANSKPLTRSHAQWLEYQVKTRPTAEKVSALIKLQKKL